MKKHVRTFFAAAALCFVGIAAQAQYSLRIIQPANVAGTVTGTVKPEDIWGAGPADDITPVTGFAQWCNPDTLGITANVGVLTGKVAVVRRGTNEFGTKALHCQDAGAIAVIIVNNGGTFSNELGAGADGPSVTIPVIAAPTDFGITYHDLIGSGMLQVSIGNFRGQLANNLSIPFDQVTVPFAFAYPAHMLNDTGDFKFPILANAVNVGNQAQNAVVIKSQVVRVSPNLKCFLATLLPSAT